MLPHFGRPTIHLSEILIDHCLEESISSKHIHSHLTCVLISAVCQHVRVPYGTLHHQGVEAL